MDKIIALVPMKGHSERVPNKNIKDFNGKPLFYWIIDTLNKSKYVKSVVVDTDSQTIANKCKEFFPDVKILDRPEEIQGDYVSMNKIIEHDIEHFKEQDHFLQTHATNPLVNPSTINEAIEEYLERIKGDYDSLFTVNRIQTRCYTHKGEPINHQPGELKRTQDLNPIYEENSNLYIFSRESFQNNDGNRIGENPYLFEMRRMESIDIDEKEDFEFAKKLHKIK